MGNQKLREAMVASLIEKLTFWFGLLESRELAIEQVRKESTAGHGSWEDALKQLGW